MKLFPFPHVIPPETFPKDGIWVKCPTFCTKTKRNRCYEFYSSIVNEPGPHICPCGFSSYVTSDSSNIVIYTGIRINSFYDRNKTKINIKSDYVPQFDLSNFERIIKEINLSNSTLQKKTILFESIADRNELNAQFINTEIHEIRKLNSQIKAQSEELSRSLDNLIDIPIPVKELQRNVYSTSSLISLRLDAYDFHVNPGLILDEKPKPMPVYRKFDKISRCLYVQQRRLHKRISLDGNSICQVQGYDIFEMLPFVLLDNALKYSPPDDDIHVTFFESKPNLNVTVLSTGPPLEKGEELRVFEARYRGKNASDYAVGSGLGLTLAKQICDIHKINISVKSERTKFLVTLQFDPERLIFD
jgi:hypothetical protein